MSGSCVVDTGGRHRRQRLIAVLAGTLVWALPGHAEELRIHLNQVALERDGPKSAVVEYLGDQKNPAASAQYTVLANELTALGGRLSAVSGFSAWGAGRQYLLADYSALRIPGTYRLKVAIGELEALSEPFTIADSAVFDATARSLVQNFHLSRSVRADDHHIRVFGTERFADVWGGWRDAGGDSGKYLSHLSYANYFNPQQAGFAAWALAQAYEFAPNHFRRLGLERPLVDEVFWGADFLHRMLAPEGYFYMTVFDRWAQPGAERVLTAYTGVDGVYSEHYQAAFREGAGVSIAALARAARLGRASGLAGVYTSSQYLEDARRAFAHLQQHNREYVDNGRENIIDDYTALLAAVELYRSTSDEGYLQAARLRASQLRARLGPDGYWRSDEDNRPFYHAADAGFPVLSLWEYLQIETDPALRTATRAVLQRALESQLDLDAAVTNPFDYPRQQFRLYRAGRLEPELRSGFFMPHANETGYWWQGESARLASLALGATLGARELAPAGESARGLAERLRSFAQHQLDWTLGRNPFDVCLLYGSGAHNAPHSWSAGDSLPGGISNGITGADGADDGSGIQFGSAQDSENWRWYEQWLPHPSWFLLAIAAGAASQEPEKAH